MQSEPKRVESSNLYKAYTYDVPVFISTCILSIYIITLAVYDRLRRSGASQWYYICEACIINQQSSHLSIHLKKLDLVYMGKCFKELRVFEIYQV